jgi:hypothetical protein
METSWVQITARNARSVQTTIGWIFWDPGAVASYEALGLPGNLGYIAARLAPFRHAGYDAAVAAFGSISPLGIKFVVDFDATTSLLKFWEARNEAILAGIATYAPALGDALVEFGPELADVGHALPTVGRPFAASHLGLPRCEHPVLAGWHAVNYLREWRGDTHWALIAAAGLTGPEASTLHNEWLDYDGNWLSQSRGLDAATIEHAWRGLEGKGLAAGHRLTAAGYELRQQLETDTNRATALPWQLLGRNRSSIFADQFEPPCEALLERVNLTAGERYQPGSRLTPRNELALAALPREAAEHS